MNRIVISLFLLIISISSCKVLSPTVMFETDKDYPYEEFDSVPQVTILQPYDQIQIMMVTDKGTTLLENSLNIGYSSGMGGINTFQGNYSGTQKNNSNSSYYQNQANNNYNNRYYGITYMVRQDSMVKLPMLGTVKLGGMIKDSAEYLLEDSLSRYYQNPYVRINIVNRNVIIFFEEGTVGQIVTIPEDGITLLDAIAQLGGLTENSKAYKIKLIRGNYQDPKVYNYNISNMDEFKKANFLLEANDIIYIDSKPRYVSKVLDELQPYLVLISTATLVYSIFN